MLARSAQPKALAVGPRGGAAHAVEDLAKTARVAIAALLRHGVRGLVATASPHANDQMREFSAKRWQTLPFHRDDVVKARVGEQLRLVRP